MSVSEIDSDVNREYPFRYGRIEMDFQEFRTHHEEFMKQFKTNISKMRNGINRCGNELECVKKNIPKLQSSIKQFQVNKNAQVSKEIVIHIE